MCNRILKIMARSSVAGAALFVAACGGESGITAEDTTINVLEPDPMYAEGDDITAIDGTAGNMGDQTSNGLDAALENAAEATENAAQAIENAQEAGN